MKYISVIILIALMSWTWSLATTERAFSLEQHKRVEAGVERDIREFIVRKHPGTTDLYCQEMYTEPVVAQKEMLVHFRCRSEGKELGGEVVQQSFAGNIRLKSEDGFQTWVETGGHIRAPEVAFTQGVQVSAKAPVGEAAEAPAAAPAGTPAAAPEKPHSSDHK